MSLNNAGNNFSIFFGIALEDKLPNVETLKVHLNEFTPFNSGKIEPQEDEVRVGSDVSGQKSNVTVSNAITATYFSFLTNRAYAPDIKTGEQVLVFRYGNAPTYYWFPLGRDDHLRRTERVTFRASDNLQVPQGLSDNNCYTLELDTKYKGHILLQTAKTGEEEFQYQIVIDTVNSKIQLCDDVGNQVLIDSKTPRVLLLNKDSAMVDLAQKNITIFAPDDIILKSGRQIYIDSPSIKSQATSIVNSADNMAMNASGSFVTKSGAIALDGPSKINSIRTQGVVAGGYGTADYRSSFNQCTGTSINVNDGSNTDPGNSVESVNGASSGRYSCAWDQMLPAVEALRDAIQGAHGANVGRAEDAVQLARQSKMKFNRGE